MSFTNCLTVLQQAGRISADESAELRQVYNEALHMPGGTRAAARQAVIDSLHAAELHQTRVQLLQHQAQTVTMQRVQGFRDYRGNAHVGEAVVDELRRVDHERMAIVGLAHADMDRVLAAGQRGAVLGDKSRQYGQQRAGLRNIVRELFGEDSGDTMAHTAAAAFRDTAEAMRQRFNAAGGAIGQLENWGLPQVHDAKLLIQAGFDSWRDSILSLLAPERMRHPVLGRAMSRAEVMQSLPAIYESITSGGLAGMDASAQARGAGALYRQRADHRFMVFRDSDAWLQYQERFGNADPFAVMMQHVNGMARDIASMERFGPTPDATLRLIMDHANIEAGNRAAGRPAQLPESVSRVNARGEVDKLTERAGAMWDLYKGTTDSPVGNTMAVYGANARNVVSATSLGGAILSAPTDLAFQSRARAFIGLEKSAHWRVIGDVVNHFSGATEREAVAAGLILDSAAHALNGQSRITGALEGSYWSRYMVDRVLTYSGLSAWTQAGRHAFGMAIMNGFTEQIGRSFAELAPQLQRTLQRGRISAADWEVVRQAAHTGQLTNPHEQLFLRPQHIARLDHPDAAGIAKRYLAMVMDETDYAVPAGTLEITAMMRGRSKPGTLAGEMTRTAGQFKAFGAAVAVLQARRVMEETAVNGRLAGAAYAANVLIAGTVFGALSIHLKDLAKGKDPRDMGTAEFWGAAILQGGGMGIYGDFLFAELNRFGGSLPTTLAGPTTGRIGTLKDLTFGNLAELAKGKKTHFGKETVNAIRQNTPMPFYLRAAYDHVLLDTIQKQVDPEAYHAFRNKVNQVKKDTKQDFYYEPGQALPSRLPDLTRAFGKP
jgi:hypothetical protein